MSLSIRQQKTALYTLMFLPGFIWSSWITRTPLMRDILQASTEVMGLLLFGFSCGSMLGILSAGKLINKYGIRRITRCGLGLMIASLAILSMALLLTSQTLTFAALALFGLGISFVDIAANIEGTAYELKIKQIIMTTLHGFFSFGTLIGALLGMAMTALGVNIYWHFAAIILITLALLAGQFRRIPWVSAHVTEEASHHGSYKDQVKHALKDVQLRVLSIVILAMALAEGSANDWLPLLMIDGHGFNHTSGTLVYVGFTAGMTLGRFVGSYFVNRYGRSAILRFSALSAAVGLLLIITTDSQWLAACAVIFWGIGASLGFPLTISAAGASEQNSTVRVTIAAIVGYFAFLVGPPALGFIGEHAGLRMAMLPVLALVILAFFCTSAAREPLPSTTGRVSSTGSDD